MSEDATNQGHEGWNAGDMGEVNVWVMPKAVPSNSEYWSVAPWDADTWVDGGLIITGEVVEQIGSLGTASFRMLRRKRSELDGDGTKLPTERRTNDDPIAAGQYVVITAGEAEDSTPSVTDSKGKKHKVVWCGVVSYVEKSDETDSDSPGSVSAIELGVLFDDEKPTRWRFIGGGGYEDNAIRSGTPGTWNLPPLAYGEELEKQTAQPNLITDQAGIKCFAFDPIENQDYVERGTKWDLLKHMFKYCTPSGWPTITLEAGDGVLALLNSLTVNLDVIELEGLNFRGVMDTVAAVGQGFAWTVKPNANKGWTVKVYLMELKGRTGDIELPAITVKSKDRSPAYDSVVVEGAPLVMCGTFDFRTPKDGLDSKSGWKGWADEDEEAYAKAKPPGKDPITQKPSETPEAYADRLNTWRGSGPRQKIFSSFRPVMDDKKGYLVRSTGGNEDRGLTALFPAVKFELGKEPKTSTDIGTRRGFKDNSPPPSIMRALTWIPYRQSAIVEDEWKIRNDMQLATPKVFAVRGDQTSGFWWDDLLVPNFSRPSVGFDVNERDNGFRITASPPDYFAWDENGDRVQDSVWVDPPGQIKLTDPISWHNLRVTVAYPSRQRLRVVFHAGHVDAYGNFVDSGQYDETELAEIDKTYSVRRRMTVSENRLQAWGLAPGTVLERAPEQETTVSDGPTGCITSGTKWKWMRNDYDAAVAFAKRLAARYLKDNAAYILELARPDALTVSVGQVLTKVTCKIPNDKRDADIVQVDGVIESIRYDFNQGIAWATTTAPVHPAYFNTGAISPSIGGPISPALGGTVAQAVQRTQEDVQRLQDRQGPLITPKTLAGGGGSGGTGIIVARIVGGNHASKTPADSDSPYSRNVAIPLGILDDENAIQNLPAVEDFSAFDLHDAFDLDDYAVPLLPDGLCWCRKVRPYPGWELYLDSDVIDSGVFAVNSVRAVLGYSEVKVHTNKNKNLSIDGNPAAFTVLETASTPPVPVAISSVSLDSSGVTLRLAVAATATMVVSWAAGWAVYDKDANANPPAEVLSAGSQSISFVGDRSVLFIALNRTSSQGFTMGTLVLLDAATTTIRDSKGVSRSFPSILAAASAAQTHDHSSWGEQGAAILTTHGKDTY
jgi:hypothetical protein